jgi:hypothetical protein
MKWEIGMQIGMWVERGDVLYVRDELLVLIFLVSHDVEA